MKKQTTFKKMALLVVVLLWGMTGGVKADTSPILVGASQTRKTIKDAYDNGVPSSISGAYIIELQSDYAPSGETFPITFAAKTGASATNTITIRPAATVSKTITSTVSPTNYTSTTTAASNVSKITVTDITGMSIGEMVAGPGITDQATISAINGNTITFTSPQGTSHAVGNQVYVGTTASAAFAASNVAIGQNKIILTGTVTINNGDYVTGTSSIPANTTVQYNSTTKEITLRNADNTADVVTTAAWTAGNVRLYFGPSDAVTSPSTSVTNSVTLSSAANLTAGMTISGASVYGTIETVNAGTNTITYTGGTQAIAAGTILTFGNIGTVFAFDGAKYITIDGQSGGTGGNKNLTIVNKSTDANASTIFMANDAFRNTVKYCNVLGATSSLSSVPISGTIVIGSTSGTTAQSGSDPSIVGSGNLYNTIDNCNIGDAHESTLPTIGVFINGNAGYSNRGNAITNCNIYNFFSARPVYSSGIYISANATLSTITGNKLYQTAVRTYTSATEGVNSPIYTSGTNTDSKSISSNIIGFSDNNQTGYTKFDGNGNFRFIGIFVGRPLTTATGNLIANIDIATSSVGVSTVGTVCGIYSNNNFPAATTAAPNVIHDIVVRPSVTTSGAHTLCGIINSQSSARIDNNQIFNLSVIPTGNAVASKLTGIYISGAYDLTIRQNKIFNLTCGIPTSTAVHTVIGAAGYATNSTQYIERNLIYNLNAISTGASVITGLSGSSVAATCYFRNNMIRLGTDVTSNTTIYGISQSVGATTFNCLYLHNTVYIGGTAPASASRNTFAFYSNGTSIPASNNTLQNNIFTNVRINTSGTASHCAIRVETTGIIKSCNYNLYWTNNITTLGMVAAVLKPTLANWQGAAYASSDASSLNFDPTFVGATGTTPPDLRITNASANGLSGPTVQATDDFYGSTRTSFTPTDLGAFAFATGYVSPTVTLTPGTHTSTTIPVTIAFSTAVTGFDITKLVITNGTAANLAGSGASYTVNILPTKDGVVTVDVLPGAGMAGGYGSTAATQLSRTFDMTPSVVISSTAAETTNLNPIPVTFTFSEAVTTFAVGDITVGNGTAGNFAVVAGTNNTTYTADITPTAAGVVTVDVAAGVAPDATPNNNTAAVQLSRTYVISPVTLTLTATAGTTSGSYNSLKSAFAKINDGTHQGAIEISINANTTETASAVLNATGGTAGYSSVKIFPTVSGLTISGDLAAPLIDLNGADYVTIDGSVNQGGVTKSLSIINTSTAATSGTSTIRMYNDATNNVVKYCTLKGSAQTGSGAVVYIPAGTTNGNDVITIQNNDITTASGVYAAFRPLNSVYCGGTSTALTNNSITIQDNNFYNFTNSATTTNGINLAGYCSTVTISGNSFYESSLAPTSAASYYIILCNSVNLSGISITSNYIGGSAPLCSGMWTKTNSNDNPFYGIYYNGTPTGTAASIQGNTIKNFNYSNSAAGAFFGFNMQGGKANIGTVTGNTIGSASGTGSITYTSVNGTFWGIFIFSTGAGAVDCQNNTIASITSSAAAASYSNLRCINAERGTETLTVSNNIIGSSTPNSIYASSTSTGQSQLVYGINLAAGTTVTSSGNTINNMTNNVNGGGGNSQIVGITSGVAGTQTISGNTISNITMNNPSASTAQTTCGIRVVNAATVGNTITGNTISGISSTSASFAKEIYGIYYSGNSTGTNTVSGNKIYGLSVDAGTTAASIYGISIFTGTTTYTNNVINLGVDTQSSLFAIYETANSSNKMYHNSVYVGGTPTANALNSYALKSDGLTNTRDFQNNIFVNARANSGAGKNYAAYLSATATTGLTINNNLYYAPNAGGNSGYYNSADVQTGATIATGLDAGSVSADPQFFAPTASTPDLSIKTNYSVVDIVGANLSATVPDDYLGNTRSDRTPHDIGAYAYIFAKAASTITATGTTSFTYTGSAQGPSTCDKTGSTGAVTYEYIGVSGTNYTASATAPSAVGSYTVTATVAADANYNAATSAALAFTITSNTVEVTTATNISTLTLTTLSDLVVSSGKLTINAAKQINSITVAPGAQLELSSGNTLNATSGVTLQSDATGTATLVDNTTSTPQAVSGTVQQRFVMTTPRNWYMSAPTAGAVVPTGKTYYSYVEAGSNGDLTASGTAYWKPEAAGNTLNPAKGYIAPISSTSTMEFNGTFNTGEYTVALTRTPGKLKEGFNLVANPYPSYIDWSVVDTTTAKIMTSVWYRTKTAGDAYTFDTYNGKSDVATTNGANLVSKLIPPMQAFWVRIKATETAGTLTFTNAMRRHVDNTSNKFKVVSNKTADTKLIRLKVSNATNSDETILCFNSNASDNFDSYDSQKMFNSTSSIPEIYTEAGTEKLVINGLKELKTNIEIPLGFVAGEASNFTIAATELKNIDSDIRVILIDNIKKVEFELNQNVAYHFNAEITKASTDRFSLIFRTAGSSTDVRNANSLNAQVFVNGANQITIVAPEKSNYAIYNAMGQMIENGIVNANLQTVNSKLNTGVYVVKVGNESSKVIIK